MNGLPIQILISSLNTDSKCEHTYINKKEPYLRKSRLLIGYLNIFDFMKIRQIIIT